MAKQLDRFIDSAKYQRYNKIAYGRSNDIFFNVQYVNYNSFAQINVFVKNPVGINIDQINLYLKENKKRYKASKALLNDGIVSVTLSSATVVKAEVLEAFLNDFSAYLQENGYTSSCTFCNSNENIGYTFTDGMVREVCPACHEKLEGIVEDIKEERETSGSYLKGALGAILGGILGIIPWVLIGMLGFVAAISGLIMSYLSYKGYMLLKGKIGKGMIWILIIVLVVFTYVGVLFSLGVSIIQEYGLEITELDVGAFITTMLGAPFDSELFETGVVWGQIVLGWFFAALGSYGFLKKAKRESSGKDLSVQRINNDLNQ